MRRAVAVLSVFVAVSCGAPSSSSTAHAIEAQVWSPYCPGRLLIDCTTSQARQLRGKIAERVERGETQQDVIDWVRSEFGDEVIASPEPSGFGLVVWLVPALIFLAGAGLVVATVRGRPAAQPRSLNASAKAEPRNQPRN